MNGAEVVAVLNRVMMIPVILCMMTAGMVRRNASDERPAGVDRDGKIVVDQSLRNVQRRNHTPSVLLTSSNARAHEDQGSRQGGEAHRCSPSLMSLMTVN